MLLAAASLAILGAIGPSTAPRDSVALLALAREQPVRARDSVRVLLRRAAGDAAGASRWIAEAQDVAWAIATAWSDSFPAAQVSRFATATPRERRIRARADSLRRAGNEAFGRLGADAAMVRWRQSLRVAASIADTAAMAAVLGNIGSGHLRLGRLDSAERALGRAQLLAERVGDRLTAANAVGALGAAARERGDHARARQLFAAASVERARIGDVRGQAADLNNGAALADAMDDRAGARLGYDQALAIARQHRLDEPAILALVGQANLHTLDGELGPAVADYTEALAICRRSGRRADEVLVLHNLGLVALRRGDLTLAMRRLEDAVAIVEETGPPADLAGALRDLAEAYAAAGDLQQAQQSLRAAEDLAPALGPAELAALALSRADLAVRFNDWPQAEAQYTRALTLARRARDEPLVTEALHGRAVLLLGREEFGRAAEALRRVHREQVARRNPAAAAVTDLWLAQALAGLGDSAGARQTLTQARTALHRYGAIVGEASALALLAELELGARAPVAAEAFARAGLEHLGDRPASDVAIQLRATLGRALIARGALDLGVRELRGAAQELESRAVAIGTPERRSALLADQWDIVADLAQVQLLRGDHRAAFESSEQLRARQMLDLLARGRIDAPAEIAALASELQDLRRRIAELTAEPEQSGDARNGTSERDPGEVTGAVPREALDRAQAAYTERLRALSDARADFADAVRVRPAPVADLQRRLGSGSALLEFLVTDSTTLAFVVTSDRVTALDLGVARAELAGLVDFVRSTLGTGAQASQAWRAPLTRLYALLIAPLDAAGLLTGMERLIVVPHLELHYLPFAALVDIRDGRFLVERFDLAAAPSAAVWLRLGAGRRPDRIAAFAPRAAELAGSRDEVSFIASLLGDRADVRIASAATEAELRRLAPLADVIHLATYGVLNRHNPLFSYVALHADGADDGRLDVHEVYGLPLAGQLVVLSACETALGAGALADVPPGDDWVGLVGSFLGAGASGVVATLWPVADAGSARLMAHFYRALVTTTTPSHALAEAQRAAIRDRALEHPFFWAAFQVVGAP